MPKITFWPCAGDKAPLVDLINELVESNPILWATAGFSQQEHVQQARITSHGASVLRQINVDWAATSESDQQKIKSWINDFCDCFTWEQNRIGRTPTEMHQIKLIPSAQL